MNDLCKDNCGFDWDLDENHDHSSPCCETDDCPDCPFEEQCFPSQEAINDMKRFLKTIFKDSDKIYGKYFSKDSR